jgi:hypothetical protein
VGARVKIETCVKGIHCWNVERGRCNYCNEVDYFFAETSTFRALFMTVDKPSPSHKKVTILERLTRSNRRAKL